MSNSQREEILYDSDEMINKNKGTNKQTIRLIL